MYNGIGLRTVRGTATNGFVQRNASFVKPTMVRARTGKGGEDWGSAVPKARKACAEIQEHDRLRQVEVKLIDYQETLEAAGWVQRRTVRAGVLRGPPALCWPPVGPPRA